MAEGFVTNSSWIPVEETKFEPGFVNTVRDGLVEIPAAEQIAEHLVNSRPFDDRVVQGGA